MRFGKGGRNCNLGGWVPKSYPAERLFEALRDWSAWKPAVRILFVCCNQSLPIKRAPPNLEQIYDLGGGSKLQFRGGGRNCNLGGGQKSYLAELPFEALYKPSAAIAAHPCKPWVQLNLSFNTGLGQKNAYQKLPRRVWQPHVHMLL